MQTILIAFVALAGPNGYPLYVVDSQVVAVAKASGVGACDTVIFTTAPNPLYVCDTPEQVIEKIRKADRSTPSASEAERKTQT